MKNRIVLLSFAVGMAVALVGSYVWCAISNSNLFEPQGAFVLVDGSHLRLSNYDITVADSLSIRVRPTKKTSEWIFVYGADTELWINGQRLEIKERSIRLYDCDNNIVEKEIECALPVLVRFFTDRVIVAGARTWPNGQIEINDATGSYSVTVNGKKNCRIVVKANWYEFTG